MSERKKKPPPGAATPARNPERAGRHPATPAGNTALNQQNRRMLGQHYRAKYGVK